MLNLRPYQANLVNDVRAAYAQGARSPLMVLPTGGGKTVVFSYIAHGASVKGKNVLVIAHRKELIRQASRKLHEAGVKHGIIAPWSEPTGHGVQVASVQTLARRLDRIPRFDLIIADEAHHAVAGTWAKLFASQPDAKILGVTATPERMDGRGLGVAQGGVFDCIVQGPSIEDLIEGKYLTPSRVFAPKETPDLSGVRMKGSDYDISDLSCVVSESKIVGNCVEHYGKISSGLPAIAFCPNVATAKLYAERFREAGWRSVAAYGDMPGDERDKAINGLADGSVQVLTTCDLISEGLDVPCVGAVILLRPTKSLGLYIQQVGRGLRPMPGKKHLIVLDHAGNTYTHGLPEMPRVWSLDGRRKKEKGEVVASPWRCEACFILNPPRAKQCRECGFVHEDAKEREKNIPEEHAGELEEVSAERMAYLRSLPYENLLKEAKNHSDLTEIARARGYKRGWVWHQKNRLQGRAMP